MGKYYINPATIDRPTVSQQRLTGCKDPADDPVSQPTVSFHPAGHYRQANSQ